MSSINTIQLINDLNQKFVNSFSGLANIEQYRVKCGSYDFLRFNGKKVQHGQLNYINNTETEELWYNITIGNLDKFGIDNIAEAAAKLYQVLSLAAAASDTNRDKALEKLSNFVRS